MSGPGDATSVQMRWQDLDGLGHVNHAVVFTYLEEARDAFLRDHGIAREEYVVGRCSVELPRTRSRPATPAVTVECGVRELGTQERHARASGSSAATARSSSRPSSGSCSGTRRSRGTRAITDAERASLSDRRWCPDERLEREPGRRHLRHHRRRRLPREQPEHPLHDEEIADSAIGAARGRGDGRPPPRPRGRRDAERPPGAVRRRDRPDPRRAARS